MDSTGPVEVICTIGCRLTPNCHKVTIVRSHKSHFPKVDFKFITAKSWSSHKMHQVHLWETQDFAVTILKSTLGKVIFVTSNSRNFATIGS